MANLYNRVKFATSTSGTGEIIVGSAEDGYQTPISAGAKIGNNLRYVIESGDNWEIGKGRFSIDYDTGTSFDPISQTTNYGGQGLAISTDGTKMYVVDRTDTYQYSLSTAYDLTTATYDNKTLAEGLYNGGNIFFKPDGTKVFYFAKGTMVNFVAYDLSTAWDITTAGSSISQGGTSSTSHFITGGTWNGDGTKLFVSHYSGQNPSVPTKIAQFNAATAYDHTSTSIGSPGDEDASVEIEGNFSQIGTGVFAIQWNSNGSELYVSDDNKVHVLTTSSYDISNLVYDRELIDADIYDFRSMYIKDESNIFIGAWIASLDPLVKKYDSTTANSSKIQRGLSKSSTGSLLSLTGSNVVFLSASAEDLLSISDGTINENIGYGVNKALFGPSDELEIYYNNSYYGEAVIKSDSDITFQSNGTTSNFNFESQDDGINGPYVTLKHTTSSPSTIDRAYVAHKGTNDAGENQTYSWIKFITSGVTNGSESGQIEFMTAKDGALTTMFKINGTNADLEIGDDGAVLLSSGTTAERPATGENGMIRYNTDDSGFEVYSGDAWGSLVIDNVDGTLVSRIIMEGATDDDYETTIQNEDPTADRTITLPDQSGTAMLWRREMLDASTSNGGIAGIPGNIAIGHLAFQEPSTYTAGAENIAIGVRALNSDTAKTDMLTSNIAVGAYAGNNYTGTRNTIVGDRAAQTPNNSNTIVGASAMAAATGINDYNTVVGTSSLNRYNGSGLYMNTVVGYYAGVNIATGDYNTMLGANAETYYTNSANNTSVGYRARSGYRYNVSVGQEAGYSMFNQSDHCTLVGYRAGYDLDGGDYCTFLGSYAGYSGGSGAYNTGVGYAALYALTSGQNNTGLGRQAGNGVTTGSQNTYLGMQSGYQSSNQSGNLNTTAVGYRACFNGSSGNNNVCIGASSEPSSTTVSNEITLGDANITGLRCNVQTISSLSDERDKTAIEDLSYGLGFINDMRPVQYTWNRRDGTLGAKKDIGFIAQELYEVELNHSTTSRTRLVSWENPSRLEADYVRTYPILIKAVQELSAKCDALEARITELEGA